MSRQPRAGKAGKPTTFRSTAAERAHWKRAARAKGCPTLSAWAVAVLNAQAERDSVAGLGRRTRTVVKVASMRVREQVIRDRLLAGFGPLGYAIAVLDAHCATRPSNEARETREALSELAKLWAELGSR